LNQALFQMIARMIEWARSRFSAQRALLCAFLAVCLIVSVPTSPTFAVQPIVVSSDQDRIELTALGEAYEGRGDTLQVDTAAGPDGAVSRMSVRAALAGTNPNWIVFALSNPSDKPIERWLAADRYTATGSGVVWPDLDARRIEGITPSLGFVPERIKSDRADVFRLTLEPGQTITYVAELTSGHFARVSLWKPLEYELKVRDRLMFNGVLLGLTGLLAVFLTAIFVANHKLVFPASALVCWSALIYLCVDFGFFHKLFQLKAEDYAVYRAASEAALAFSLVVFLHVFLRLALWGGMVRMLVSVWMLAQIALVAIAVIDPRLAATFARVSFGFIGLIGSGLVIYLSLRGQDRALSLVPTWMLFNIWIFAAGMVLSGRLTNEMAASSLVAGLVLILLLIGFTVTQYAFRSVDPVFAGAPSELQMRSLAVDSAGASVWEWNTRRDEMKTDSLIEDSLGLSPGELNTKTDDFLRHVNEVDRERVRQTLWGLREANGGELSINFRMRHADNSYRWFEIEGASVPTEDPKTLRCVGLMRDVTDTRRAHERLVQNAVKCSITGLPHREILLDRMSTAMLRARTEPGIRPTLISLGIDKFKSVNTSYGMVIGDSLLLTVARRLQRHIGPQDTLSRIGGDQFGILLIGEQSAADISSLAERIRRSLRSPIKIAGQDIVLTGSLGIAIYDGEQSSGHDLLKESESALYLAKRGGTDRIEVFRPEMRAERDDRVIIETELRKAIEKNQIRVFYQPIVALGTEELAGFEALVRWEHPKDGLINPAAFIPIAEDSDLILKLGSYVLNRAVKDAVQWQQELPRTERPLFVSVNVSRRQLLRDDLVQEVRSILGRSILPPGTLKLEITESLVMENPEQAAGMLEQLRGTGAELALDDFGAGYSSLAYLHQFPFDTIKIDRSLIHSGGGLQSANATIVRSMVALAHELGKHVVAEGVETAEDASFLRGIECEYAQGYYFGEPLPEKDVLAMLRTIRKTESKLQPRTLFRPKPKAKPADKPSDKPDVAARSLQSQDNGNAARAALGAAAMAAAAAASLKPVTPVSPVSRLPKSKVVRPGPQQSNVVPLAPPMPMPMPATGPIPGPMPNAPNRQPPFILNTMAENNVGIPSPYPSTNFQLNGPPPLPVEPPMTAANDAAALFAPRGSIADTTPADLNGQFAPAPQSTDGIGRPEFTDVASFAETNHQDYANPNGVGTGIRGLSLADALSQLPPDVAQSDFDALAASLDRGPANGPPMVSETATSSPPFMPMPALKPVDLSKLPPSVAASLARLAGTPVDPMQPKPLPIFVKPASGGR
jgi:diguanylate cyclase (GGDEF)-like protein/PAS domain S-box-containing protein